MSYLNYIDYYKEMVLSGRLPYPYYFPYISNIPNISNFGCENSFYQKIYDQNCFNYDGNKFFDSSKQECHNPSHNQSNNISYNDRDPADEINDYLYYYYVPYQDPSCTIGFYVKTLSSNIPNAAANLDMNLLDAWDIILINDIIWISNTGTGLLTSYNLMGNALPDIVNVFGPFCNISQPTGIVYNDNVYQFPIIKGPLCEGSNILVATRDGTINGYNKNIDSNNCIQIIDNSVCCSIYTGITLVFGILYVVDFFNKKIDVYDEGFNRIINFFFIDEFLEDPIPPDFTPFNIVCIDDFLFVLYAKQNPLNCQYELPGSGNGYVNIFNLAGKFVNRYLSRGVLNAPWGLLLAPSHFGYPAGSIMISNAGDGIINVFDNKGKYLGNLKDGCGVSIYLKGLKALKNNPNSNKILYWTSSSNNLETGSFGIISMNRNI